MDINWTQVIAQAVSTAFIVPVTTITTFLVMRYFPKFWERLENGVKTLAKTKTEEDKEN